MEEHGDDMGSGWLQVKKKHRSTSKFSTQTWSATSNLSSTSHRVINQDTVDSSDNVHIVILKEKLDALPKIKWGDLLYRDNLDASEIKFAHHSFVALTNLGNPSTNDSQQDQAVPTETSDVPFQDNQNEIVSKVMPVDEKLAILNDSELGETHHQDVEPMNLDSNTPHLAVEAVGSLMSPQPYDKSKDGALQISQVHAEKDASTTVTDENSLLHQLNKSDPDPEVLGDVPVAAVIEDLEGMQSGMESMTFSKARFMSALEESESSETKERFRQRLWCFLFENLNRAVDELYLLCELECDLDQMKEAVLVLEEARSDFRELRARVEEFENVKRSSSQPPVDEQSVNVKTDHRRPHALSWEVRRMAASPHRAEILSSSLEAFKKIQYERTSMCSSRDAKTLNLAPADNHGSHNFSRKSGGRNIIATNDRESLTKLRKHNEDLGLGQRHLSREKRVLHDCKADKNPKYMEPLKRQIPLPDKEREKERRNTTSMKSMDAWKEKRNWEDILASPLRVSSRVSHSPGIGRKSVERARVLHDKLMSPEKKRRTALDLKKEAEEKHARAMRIRSELENERVQRLQRTSEKVNRVNEWQADRTMKLREGMHVRHQRGESRHEAHLAQVVRRAGDESSKVNEVRFITSLNEENKKFILRQKLHDSELRRAEKLQVIKTKQKEDMAREEAVLERRKLLEAEKLQRLSETQRKKEEAQVRREEERKASSAAREARAIEQLKRKEVRAKAQQEEAELLAQKLAERLSESEQRRKFYLEQIREKASMDFRDQSSPLMRRSSNRESLGRSTSTTNIEDYHGNNISGIGGSDLGTGDSLQQHSLKRRIKKIRQRLMAMKYEFSEIPVSLESAGIGYITLVGTAREKIGRWLQELQKLRQARKGAASIGVIVVDLIKFLEGKEPELHASRQAGLLDFIASALPASHTSKPEACQVTIYLLRLLRVVISVPANRSYFLSQNLLPPIIPMLYAALENYIKIAASLNLPVGTKTSIENFESVSEVLEGFLWTTTTIIGHTCLDERHLKMKEGLLELVIAYQVTHRLRDLFALYDRPQVEGSPFPSSIILSLDLLAVLTSRPRSISSIDWESFIVKAPSANDTQDNKLSESVGLENSSLNIIDGGLKKDHVSSVLQVNASETSATPKKSLTDLQSKPLLSQNNVKASTDIGACPKTDNVQDLKQPMAFLLSVVAETGLVSLPSLLTAVLLQANTRLSSEQGSYVLPSNFEEAATGVLKVLNNLALLDITLLQGMLARPDLKMEFFHFMSFLLSHCTNKWKMAKDQVGVLLLEALLLLGYFALFHPGNQAVLRWGKSPTILHKVCDLPFVFFSDPELMPILAGTLVAVCYGCEQNRVVVQQELSTEMLLSLLGSCRNELLAVQSNPILQSKPLDNPIVGPCESNQSGPEPRKIQVDFPVRSVWNKTKNSRISAGKGDGAFGSTVRVSKARNQKDIKTTKTSEEVALKHNLPRSETSATLMLHSRFPSSFIDSAERFFSEDVPSV